MKAEISFLLVLIVSLMGLWSQSAESNTDLPAGKVVFKIGQEDKSNREFKRTGFKGVHEFNCTAGIDCTVGAFPKRLYRMSAVQSLLL